MRKVIFGLIVAGSFVMTSCDNAESKINNSTEGAESAVENTEAATGTASFQWEADRHDFGEITEGTVAQHTFKFENTGDAPLIIYNAQGSCGCTVPVWPREAIAPGETGEIQVSFNSQGKPGANNKQVTLTANTVPNKVVLNISANVTKVDAQNAAE